MLPQQYCLRWKYHHSNLQTMFSQLLDRGCFCDVTLACEGQLLRAHRVVLCACSSFFDTLLTNYSNERDPIIIMKDVTFEDVKCLIEFMYKGEINVEHSNLASLLKTADDLKIKGLAEVSWRDDEDPVAAASGSAIDYHQTTRSYDTYAHEQHAQPHGHTPAHAHHQHQHHHNQQPHPTQPPSNSRRQSGAVADDELRRSPSEEAADLRKTHHQQQQRRLPNSTSQSISIAPVATGGAENYLGPKRKRGRPPMDDSYDVFNIHKLAQFSAAHADNPSATQADSHSAYPDERRQHSSSALATSPPSSSAAAAAAAIAYQQHVEQQAKQRRQRQPHAEADNEAADAADDAQTDPEWINSNLEVNVGECETAANEGTAKEAADSHESRHDDMHVSESQTEMRKGDADLVTKRKRKNSHEEGNYEQPEQREPLDKHAAIEPIDDEEEDGDALAGPVPQSVEEIENMHHVLEHQLPGTSTAGSSSSSSTSTSSNVDQSHTSASTDTASTTNTATATAATASVSTASLAPVGSLKSSRHPSPSPLITAAAHFGKYMAADGYLLNEHGMLMTHDFIHAPTVSIPTSSAALANAAAAAAVAAAAASNGHANGGGVGDHEFADIKMEDYDAADLRLTSEEMTQWQDVIKMDDYLAKGRRPQFWEEPFTRRVLDAIKNKRLEMKKAARILGVSYGTLYGRYREVYGCLKHPYSSTTFRASQSSQLSVQPRFDMVWPSPKRDAALLAGQLEVGKIRPKDLSELWTRPQI